jgi:mono/diheme cytochrome c family protein
VTGRLQGDRTLVRVSMSVVAAAVVLAGCGGSSGPGTPLDAGRSVYADVCSVCHGATGDGGVGPALDDVVATWPACRDHISWIRLGSERWRSEVGPTYGAADKPVAGGMPAHEQTLSDAEIASVAAFERVRFGGLDSTAALTECGIAPENSDG